VPRLQLPQNYLLNQGTVVENFSNFAGWTNETPSAGTISADTVHYRGTQGVKFTANAGQSLTAYKNVSLNLKESGSILRLWVYIPDPLYVSSFNLEIYSNNTWYHTWKSFDCSARRSVIGWNCLTVHKDSMGRDAQFDWASVTKIRLTFTALAGRISEVTFGEISLGTESLSRIMIQFDDAISTEYTKGFDYLYNQMGKMGTIWVVPALVGGSGYMTKSNLDIVYSAGWALGNHTYSHSTRTRIIVSAANTTTSLTIGATPYSVSGTGMDAAQIAAALAAAIGSIAHDLGDGSFWLDSGTVSSLVNCSASQTGITYLDKDGQKADILACSQWLIANGYIRAAYHVAWPSGVSNADTYKAMDELGMLTGRGIVSRVEPAPAGERYQLMGPLVTWGDKATHPTQPEITVDTVKSWIDTAVSTGSSLSLIFHHLADDVAHITNTTDYLFSDFKTIVDYAIARGLKFVTIDEWYNGLTNPRYRSVPLSRTAV